MSLYFTITAGRSGSAWLTNFLGQNLNIPSIHEPLGIDDFGTRMPDIKLMRTFNNYGNIECIKSFWKRKFAGINYANYAETNHTLAKCGLVENLIANGKDKETTIIILKRNIAKQCISYLLRKDFNNITIAWQWYLHPTYTKKLINPEPFSNLGMLSLPLWYSYEIEARQEYYLKKFSTKIKMVEVNLEDIVTEDGANMFLSKLGHNKQCILPPAQNQSKTEVDVNIIDKVNKVVNDIDLDIEKIVDFRIQEGFSFEVKNNSTNTTKISLSFNNEQGLVAKPI